MSVQRNLSPNSVLALGGLGLFFGGVIHVWWWAGICGRPLWRGRARVAAQRFGEDRRTDRALHRDAGAAGAQTGGQRGPEAFPGIAWTGSAAFRPTLTELLPRLQELRDRGIISAKDSFTVVETVRRYLPDTLGAYLRLPRLYAQMQALADGRTASRTLLDQLTVLDTSLKDVAKSAFAGDAEALVTNGQFLQNKFSEQLAFRP